MSYRAYLSTWIKEKVTKAGMRGVIVGISGGIDSAVVALLAKAAFPTTTLGVIMPINAMGTDLDDGLAHLKKFAIPYQIVDLAAPFQHLKTHLNLQNNLALANIKPRLRMTTLYALAQEHQYLVLGTDNAAEWALGYFTKYGDGGVDLLPIIHLTKGEVKKLALAFGVAPAIITKEPSAGLWDDQSDEAELGFSYQAVDNYLQNGPIAAAVQQKIVKQITQTAHKREPIPQPKPRRADQTLV